MEPERMMACFSWSLLDTMSRWHCCCPNDLSCVSSHALSASCVCLSSVGGHVVKQNKQRYWLLGGCLLEPFIWWLFELDFHTQKIAKNST